MKPSHRHKRSVASLISLLLGALLVLAAAAPLQAKLILEFYPGWKKYQRPAPAARRFGGGSAPVAAGKTWTEPVTGMQFMWVPGGCFQMGSTDGGFDEKPVHKVCVDGFWMGKTEVTQGQWRKIMGSNPSYFKYGDNYPVEKVSWNDARNFSKKLSGRSGKRLRLPTEAEWEYAARSGGKDEKYAGGSDVGAVAWYDDNSGGKTHPVGQKRPNGLGLYDMSGNVWEWCRDWYGKDYYKHSPRNNPQGPSSGSLRVSRGGSWGNRPSDVRSANRIGDGPGDRNGVLGFRLVFPARSR